MKDKKHIEYLRMYGKYAVIALAVTLAMLFCISSIYAARPYWAKMSNAEVSKSGVVDMYSEHNNISDNSGTATIHTELVYKVTEEVEKHFDELYQDKSDDSSRLMYYRTIPVSSGTTINAFAALEDKTDRGGSTQLDDGQFYYSVLEFDGDGYIVYDGDWRSVTQSWTVGETTNDSSYGENIEDYQTEYPVYSDDETEKTAAERRQGVKYAVVVFRIASGDLGLGAGEDKEIYTKLITDNYKLFYITTRPFTYTFDLKGGSVDGKTGSITVYRNGLEAVEAPAEPVSSRGYVFKGWKVTCGGINEETEYSSSSKQYGRVYSTGQLNEMFGDTLFYSSFFGTARFEAQWEAPVTYDANGGCWEGHAETTWTDTFKKGESYTTQFNWYKRNGYKFVGWNTNKNTKPDGSVSSGSKGDWWAYAGKTGWGAENTVTKDGVSYWKGSDLVYEAKTLYAIWTPGVTYKSNYPEEAKQALKLTDRTSVTYPEYGKEYTTEEIGGWKPDGYIFAGWNTGRSATIDTATGWGWCTSHVTENGGSVKYWSGTFRETAPVTLYAIWVKEYRVTYDANGGHDSKADGTTRWTDGTALGKNYVTQTNKYKDGTDWFVKTGHVFKGWNEKADGTGTDWTGYMGKPWKWSYKKDITLYAQWEPEAYIVAYDAGGGAGSMPDDRAVYGESFMTSEYGFTRPGYAFDGWTEAGGATTGTRWLLTSPGVYESGKSWKWGYDYGITLRAVWKVQKVSYRTEHYILNTGGDSVVKDEENYTLYQTDTAYSDADSHVTPKVLTIEGFTSPAAQTVKVSGDGTTVVRYYYVRNRYTLTVESGTGTGSVSVNSASDGITLTGSGVKNEYWYGEKITVSAEVLPGYAWSGWYDIDGKGVYVKPAGTSDSTGTGTFTMPARNAGIRAVTNAGAAKYTVKHWTLKTGCDESVHNSDSYMLYKTTQHVAETQSQVTPAVLSVEGFTSPETQTVTVAGDGTTVVNYYYVRNMYNLTVKGEYGINAVYIQRINGNVYAGPEAVPEGTVLKVQYGERFRVSASTHAWYDWEGWSGTYESTGNPFEVRSMPAHDVTLTAEALPRSVKIVFHRNINQTDTEVSEQTFTVNSVTAEQNSSFAGTGWENDRPGYKLSGWSDSSSGSIPAYRVHEPVSNSWIADRTVRHLYGVWVTDDNTAYRVNHWFENIGSDRGENPGYKLKKTETLYGTTDSAVTPEVLPENECTGFTAPACRTVIIKGDGSTVVDYYYGRNSYMVTYDAGTNGGFIKASSAVSAGEKETQLYFKYGEGIDLSVPAQKSGMQHVGWNTQPDADAGLDEFIMPAENVRLYAIYRKDITVTYVYWNESRTDTQTVYNNTGSAQFTMPSLDAERNVLNAAAADAMSGNDTQSILYGIKDVKPLGYTDVKNAVYNEGETVTITDSITLYVQYGACAEAEYDLMGGTPNDATGNTLCRLAFLSADKGSIKTDGINLPTCQKKPYTDEAVGTMTTYVLKGWRIKQNGGLTGELMLPGSHYDLKKNTEFAAVWDEAVTSLTYTIHFDGNGGPAVSNVPEDIHAYFGRTYTLTDTIKKTGCYITGWNTRADGMGQSFSPRAEVTNLASSGGETVTLYAQWKFVGFRIVGVGSTMHGQMFIREPDDTVCEEYREIYEQIKNRTIWDCVDIPPQQCVKQWKIDKDGNITKLK